MPTPTVDQHNDDSAAEILQLREKVEEWKQRFAALKGQTELEQTREQGNSEHPTTPAGLEG